MLCTDYAKAELREEVVQLVVYIEKHLPSVVVLHIKIHRLIGLTSSIAFLLQTYVQCSQIYMSSISVPDALLIEFRPHRYICNVHISSHFIQTYSDTHSIYNYVHIHKLSQLSHSSLSMSKRKITSPIPQEQKHIREDTYLFTHE